MRAKLLGCGRQPALRAREAVRHSQGGVRRQNPMKLQNTGGARARRAGALPALLLVPALGIAAMQEPLPVPRQLDTIGELHTGLRTAVMAQLGIGADLATQRLGANTRVDATRLQISSFDGQRMLAGAPLYELEAGTPEGGSVEAPEGESRSEPRWPILGVLVAAGFTPSDQEVAESAAGAVPRAGVEGPALPSGVYLLALDRDEGKLHLIGSGETPTTSIPWADGTTARPGSAVPTESGAPARDPSRAGSEPAALADRVETWRHAWFQVVDAIGGPAPPSEGPSPR
jgi:hypothetical protein